MIVLAHPGKFSDLRWEVVRRARSGAGWEDICLELKIHDQVTRATVREIVLEGAYYVAPVRPWSN